MDRQTIWAFLRSTRSEPSARATESERRRHTYTASLEQMEQMFVAAAAVGVATRPLLAFYGLSQAGRAIAAAADVADEDYRLFGHGITAKPSTLDGAISEVELSCPQKSPGSSFKRLSSILKSPTWLESEPVKLRELWGSLPETEHWPLTASEQDPPLRTSLDDISLSSHAVGPARLMVADVPRDTMPTVGTSSTPELAAFIAKYPVLRGHTSIYVPDDYQRDEGVVYIGYPSDSRAPEGRRADVESHRTPYRFHHHYAFPAVGANAEALHPLMAWWAILFALSMLARYHPDAWEELIAIDRSEVAVAIERLLAVSLTAVPELVLETIHQVAK